MELSVFFFVFFFFFPPFSAPKKLMYFEMCDLPGVAWECLWWEWQCLLQRLHSTQTVTDEQITAQTNNMRKNTIYCKILQLCDLEIFNSVFCQTASSRVFFILLTEHMT